MEGAAQISRKKLHAMQPALYVVIDGANLIQHTARERMLVLTDEIDINRMVQRKELRKEDINIELLYNVLVFLQGTALNLAGLQRVFVRTLSNKLIALDPRLSVPKTFNDFSFMMWRFCKENLVKGQNGEKLLYYVKSDIGSLLPPDVPRYCAIVSSDRKIDKIDTIVQNPICIYLNLDVTQECRDEVMQRVLCVSNDALGCSTVAARVVREVEIAQKIW